MKRNTCYKFENGEQHIHKDGEARVTSRFLRYFLFTEHKRFQAHPLHKTVGDYPDVLYKTERHMDFQWELLKADWRRFVFSTTLNLWLNPQRGAIAFDTFHEQAATASPMTFSYTVTGTNNLLVQGITNGSTNANDITAASFNSVATTLLANKTGSARNYFFYYSLGVDTGGAHTLSVTFTSAHTYFMAASSYTGVSQSGFPDSSGSNSTDSGSSITASTTVVASNCWLVASGGSSNGSVTAGTGTTQRTVASSECQMVDSNATVGTGSQSLVIQDGASERYGLVVASIAPAGAAAASVTSTLTMMGCGMG